MAAEIETYLMGKGTENSLKFDGRPLVRFIVDDNLKSGRFEIIAENVAAPIIAQLRDEEMEFYGLKEPSTPSADSGGSIGAARGVPIEELGIAGASAVLPIVGTVGAAGVAGVLESAGAFRSMGAVGTAGATDIPDFSDDPDVLDIPTSQSSSRDSLKKLPMLSVPGAAIGRARLTNHNAGKSYALTGSVMTLGRDSACDIVIDDANVSRKHAQLTQDVVGTWKLSDLDSTNGTLLNRAPVTTALLRDGDQISIGVTVLEFRESR
jgi:hypothetical protein